MTPEQINNEMAELFAAIRMLKARIRTKENLCNIASMEAKYERLAKELKQRKREEKNAKI